MSILKAQVSFPSNFASPFSAIKYNSLVLFYLKNYMLWSKGNPLKCNFFRLSSIQVKMRQVPHVNVETTSQFLSKFCIILHCHNT